MRNSILLLLLVIISFPLIAQPETDRASKMEERLASMRIAYITNKLDLTPKESQDFWPVYNEFTKSLDEIKKDHGMREDPRSMTEEEAEAFLQKSEDVQQQELELKVEYMNRLKSILPSKKIALLIYAEREFRRDILSRRKNRDSRSNLRRKN